MRLIIWLAAAIAAAALSLVPAPSAAQKVSQLGTATLPDDTMLLLGSQGSGCATQAAPCASVKFSAGALAAYFAGQSSFTAAFQPLNAPAPRWTTARTLSFTGDATGSMSVDGSINVSTGLTLATVNSAPGACGASGSTPIVTINAKGLATSCSTTPTTDTTTPRLAANQNLADVPNPATARANLGLTIGTNVQAFASNLTTYAGIAPGATGQALLPAATPAAARTTLQLTRVYPSGRYLLPESVTYANTGAVMGSGTERALLLYLREPVTINGLGLKMTTPASGGNIQLAIYAANATTLAPTGAALYAGASLSTTTAGNIIDSAPALAIGPGYYWIAINSDATAGPTAIFQGVAGTGMGQVVGSTNPTNVLAITGLSRAQTFGTWPTHSGSYASDSWAEVITTATPAISFKVQ